MTEGAPMSLRAAIEQALNLGETDPRVIAQQVISRHGEGIVLSEIDASEYAADVARRLIGSRRRGGIRALVRDGASPVKRDVMLTVVYLPGLGYWKLGDCTAAEFDVAAQTSRKAEHAFGRYADWFEQQAAVIRSQGVTYFREVKGPLSSLPPVEEEAA